MNHSSLACALACANTQRSRGTPAAAAASAQQRISAVAWSTWMFAVSRFRYGSETGRLSGVAASNSSASNCCRIRAWGFAAATFEKRDHSVAISRPWAARSCRWRGPARRTRAARSCRRARAARRQPPPRCSRSGRPRRSASVSASDGCDGQSGRRAGLLVAAQRRQRLGARDERDLDLARRDRARRIAEQPLRAVAAEWRSAHRLARRDPEFGRDQRRLVGVRPAQRRDVAARVGLPQQCVAGAAVVRRQPQRLDRERDRAVRAGVAGDLGQRRRSRGCGDPSRAAFHVR